MNETYNLKESINLAIHIAITLFLISITSYFMTLKKGIVGFLLNLNFWLIMIIFNVIITKYLNWKK